MQNRQNSDNTAAEKKDYLTMLPRTIHLGTLFKLLRLSDLSSLSKTNKRMFSLVYSDLNLFSVNTKSSLEDKKISYKKYAKHKEKKLLLAKQAPAYIEDVPFYFNVSGMALLLIGASIEIASPWLSPWYKDVGGRLILGAFLVSGIGAIQKNKQDSEIKERDEEVNAIEKKYN